MLKSAVLSGSQSFRRLAAATSSIDARCQTTYQASTSRRCFRISAKNDDEDGDDEEAPVPGKPLRVERLLANLGYGKRKECQQFVQKGRAIRRDGKKLKVGDKVLHSDILLEGEELDAPFPVGVMVNKPVGYVVTAPDDDKILDPKVYDLLPYRFGRRRPFLSSVGRLDKATSGMLLLTDDGQLVHRINTPKKGIWKVYEATLAAPLLDKEAEAAAKRFASGGLQLQGDYDPLLPAKLLMLSDTTARVSICEGRYHQIRRMFAAVGHEVLALHRVSVGGLAMDGLPDGEWRYLTQADIDAVFSGPTTEDVLQEEEGASSSTKQPQLAAAGALQIPRLIPDPSSQEEPGQTPESSSSSSLAGTERRAVLRHSGATADDEGDEVLLIGDEEEEDDGIGGLLANPASPAKKMRDDERRRRRKMALQKMVKSM